MVSSRYNHYNKKLQPFARANRNGATKAEIRIWCELLRNKQMLGYSFLRQRPIGYYIADFFCKELKLVIEVDGFTHHMPETKIRDERKDEYLIANGYNVMRFTDDEVNEEIARVKVTIEEWIRSVGR